MPDAVESVSYGVPTFTYRGRPLIYFGAAKKHCALYATSDGTVRFPPDEPPSVERINGYVRTRIGAIEAAPRRGKRGGD